MIKAFAATTVSRVRLLHQLSRMAASSMEKAFLCVCVCVCVCARASVKVIVILRLTISRPVRSFVRHPSGIRDQFFPFSLWLFFSFRQVLDCWCGAPSLTRSRVCTFHHSIVYCLYFLNSPNLQVPVFISPRNRVAQLYPWAFGCMCVSERESWNCENKLSYCRTAAL
jgi:hypothetical protein